MAFPEIKDWPQYWEKTLIPSMHLTIEVLQKLDAGDVIFVSLHVAAYIASCAGVRKEQLQEALSDCYDFWSNIENEASSECLH